MKSTDNVKGLLKKLYHPGRGKGYQPNKILKLMLHVFYFHWIKNNKSFSLIKKVNIFATKKWHYLSRGEEDQAKECQENPLYKLLQWKYFQFFNNPPKNLKNWKYSAIKLQFWVSHYMLSLHLFNIVWKTWIYILYKTIILTRLFLFLYWYIFEYI